MIEITLTRKEARAIIDLLEGGALLDALDEAQGDATEDEPAYIQIKVLGGDI